MTLPQAEWPQPPQPRGGDSREQSRSIQEAGVHGQSKDNHLWLLHSLRRGLCTSVTWEVRTVQIRNLNDPRFYSWRDPRLTWTLHPGSQSLITASCPWKVRSSYCSHIRSCFSETTLRDKGLLRISGWYTWLNPVKDSIQIFKILWAGVEI